MASDGERPDLRALTALEDMLRHLELELSGWRRRALAAETKGVELSRALDADETKTHSRQLEKEGRELAGRIEQARGRVNDLIARLSFLEQQSDEGEGNQP